MLLVDEYLLYDLLVFDSRGPGTLIPWGCPFPGSFWQCWKLSGFCPEVGVWVLLQLEVRQEVCLVLRRHSWEAVDCTAFP